MIFPPRMYPTATVSLKNTARGLCIRMSDAWKLVCEKTIICDSTGTFSASSTDRR